MMEGFYSDPKNQSQNGFHNRKLLPSYTWW